MVCPNQLLVRGVLVPCRVCAFCRTNQVEDWVGRCRAEMVTARHSFLATLTYGGDDRYMSSEDNLRAKMVHYSDVTLWLKRLRRSCSDRIRYFAVAEMGARKGRVHFHVMVFCHGGPPPGIELSEPGGRQVRYMHDPWPHGWSHWRPADVGSARYALKYLVKTDIFTEEKRYGFSRKLGGQYFEDLALRHVSAGLVPRDLFYSFADDVKKDGTPRRYFLSGVAAFRYLETFAVAWRRRFGDEKWPYSPLMDMWEDERDRRLEAEELKKWVGGDGIVTVARETSGRAGLRIPAPRLLPSELVFAGP